MQGTTPDGGPRRTPPPPPEPVGADACCGSGCSPCVLDVYAAALADYQHRLAIGDWDTAATDRSAAAAGPLPLSELEYRPFPLVSVERAGPSCFFLTATTPVPMERLVPPGQHVVLRYAQECYAAGG